MFCHPSPRAGRFSVATVHCLIAQIHDIGTRRTYDHPAAHFKIKRGRIAACQCENETDVVPGGGTAERAHSAEERPDDADANGKRRHVCGERRSTVPNSRVSVKNLLRASNFRVPNDSRYGIDVHTHEARVTRTSNDRKDQSTGKRRAIA